jgi:hypothetical protein
VNRSSTHKLVKVSGGITLFAEVTVSISENTKSNEISISEHVFDWLKEEYGPQAIMWPVNDNDEFIKGARKGIEHVVKNLVPNQGNPFITFTVERIFVSMVDSTGDTVAYAACFAAWKALDIDPIFEPKIRGQQIIFV